MATLRGRYAYTLSTTIGALFNQPAKDLAEATLAGAGATLCPSITALGWDAELLK